MRMMAEPHGITARRYRVVADGATITEISFALFGPSTAMPIAGRAYRLRRAGLLRDDFALETDDGTPVAKARQGNALRHDFEVVVGARRLHLRAESSLRSDYLLLDGDQRIGALHPAGPMRRGVEADLPDSLPLEARIFVLWVVLTLWRGRRVTRAGAGD